MKDEIRDYYFSVNVTVKMNVRVKADCYMRAYSAAALSGCNFIEDLKGGFRNPCAQFVTGMGVRPLDPDSDDYSTAMACENAENIGESYENN